MVEDLMRDPGEDSFIEEPEIQDYIMHREQLKSLGIRLHLEDYVDENKQRYFSHIKVNTSE